jgi:hypothetical protein
VPGYQPGGVVIGEELHPVVPEFLSFEELFFGLSRRTRYDQFKAPNIPLGSGAVESCVRRLVNLRMKGNSIFWRLDNAERLLFLRGQLLAGRWDSFIDAVLQPADLQAAH